jgi:hypothetical protein
MEIFLMKNLWKIEKENVVEELFELWNFFSNFWRLGLGF